MEKTLEQKPSTCLKVVLFGPESTGKTTLAQELAAYFKTPWVPEYMRTFAQAKWNEKAQKLDREDLLPIASGQMQLENELTKEATHLLFCDTNLLQLKVYSEYYYNGYCPEPLAAAVNSINYRLYLLTYIDTPWVADELRDRPDDRLTLFRTFEAELKKHNLPYHIIRGGEKERLKKAIAIIEKLGKS